MGVSVLEMSWLVGKMASETSRTTHHSPVVSSFNIKLSAAAGYYQTAACPGQLQSRQNNQRRLSKGIAGAVRG